MREIWELRVAGVKIRLSEQPFLMRPRLILVENAGSSTQYEPAFPVDFILESRHSFSIWWD